MAHLESNHYKKFSFFVNLQGSNFVWAVFENVALSETAIEIITVLWKKKITYISHTLDDLHTLDKNSALFLEAIVRR